MAYRYDPNRRERVGIWFERGLVAAGAGFVLFDLLGGTDGTIFAGLMILFLWSFIVGQRNGLLLQGEERKYLEALRAEEVRYVDKKRLVRITLLASTPLYLGFALPILLLPIGGFYAIGFFIPLFGISGLRMNVFYQRWKQLEIKPNFYWWMQLGICLGMVVGSYLLFYFGMGGEVR